MITRLLDKLRKQEYGLGALPEVISYPAGADGGEITVPIEAATLDQIAFARVALQQRSSALYREIEALRGIYEIARQNGAHGADNAFDAATAKEGR